MFVPSGHVGLDRRYARPCGEAGATGRPANPASVLDRLLEHLMEPVGRQARRRAVEAIRDAGLLMLSSSLWPWKPSGCELQLVSWVHEHLQACSTGVDSVRTAVNEDKVSSELCGDRTQRAGTREEVKTPTVAPA
jgi:hypothetical protein